VAEFDQRGQQVWNQFNIVGAPSQAGRVDASLVGRWECVAIASSVASGTLRPWGLWGSCFVHFGAEGRGRIDYVGWRCSTVLRSGRTWDVLANGMREFAFSAADGSYRELLDPFIGNLRCTVDGVWNQESEATFRFPRPLNYNYVIAGDVLTIYSDTARKDYRRCGPG
jgi:hypothetical protein